MRNINILFFFFALFIIACNTNIDEKTDKYQKKRNNIINVQDNIVDIKTEMILGVSLLDIIDDFLIITEAFPNGEKGMHLFNKNTFEYITSTAIIGKGPGEVARQGSIEIDYSSKGIWLSDYGKKLMWKFPLDSILNNNMFKPTEKRYLHDELFIERYGFLNDSIIIGKAVRLLPGHHFEKVTTKLNINNNKIEEFGYEHPKAIGGKSSSDFKLLLKNNLYVNCYMYCDLITICNLNGKLKYNIYGSDWLRNEDNNNSYFYGVDFFKNYIIASYNGGNVITLDKYKRKKGNNPTKFIVFNLEGDYIRTIETGHSITFFCVDEENKRLIVYFNDRENPLGYFNLNLD